MTAHSDLHWPSTPAPGPWREDAACRGVDLGIFFPEGALALEAKAICRSCPVIEQCRAYARAHAGLHGIWGGEGEKARQRRRWR